MKILRDYQLKLKYDIYQAWRDGYKNVLAVSPTGSGKTAVLANIYRECQMVACAIAHRQELVQQISCAMADAGVYHRIIAPKHVVQFIIQQHIKLFGRSFVHHQAPVGVVGVDTLLRRADEYATWLKQGQLWSVDEGHHLLRTNKWGKAVALFVNAIGLGFTATPERTDRKALGAHAEGVFHHMALGPTPRELINRGHLADYKIFGPKASINRAEIEVSKATGELNQDQTRKAAHKSKITGDIVSHYLNFTPGKLGITFTVDVELANDTAAAFNNAGVPAIAVSAKTDDKVRTTAIERFARGEIKQLVNVDLFGEGFDVPAVEVVSMGRPTASYGLYCLDPETEVLTPEGWLKSTDALNSENVMAFDLSDNSIHTVSVLSGVLRSMYDDESMYEFNSPNSDILVSDKHEMIVKGHSWSSKNWQKQTAEIVSNRKGMFKIPVSGFGQFSGSGLSESELHFLGWYMSDGTINKKTNAFQIGQSEKKIYHVNHIEKTLIGCGFKYGKRVQVRKNVPDTHSNNIVFSVSYGIPRGRDKHLKGYSKISPWLSKEVPRIFNTLTREEFLTVLHSWNLGDGLNGAKTLNYNLESMRITCGTNKIMADRLQELCVVRGLRCNIARFKSKKGTYWYTCYIKDVQTSSVAGSGVRDGSIGKKTYKRSRFVKSEKRPDYVWCLTNKLGTLITRRNGKVAIIGNCQQFGRALRPSPGKTHGIIIDHVDNVVVHKLPDRARVWSLDAVDRRGAKKTMDDAMPVRTCTECFQAYEAVTKTCPYCGHVEVPAGRSLPEQVDGDLHEYGPELLAKLRGEMDYINGPARVSAYGDPIVGLRIQKNHGLRQDAQRQLQESIAYWAGIQREVYGRGDSESYRRFYHTFGIDIATACTLHTGDALKLLNMVRETYV